MTAGSRPDSLRFVVLSADDLRERLMEAMYVYVDAMEYPRSTAEHRAPMWVSHMFRPGWRCVAALDDDRLLGVAYGYTGERWQWWHEQVRTGVLRSAGATAAEAWLGDYFELTELHVHPEAQGMGLGETLTRELLTGVGHARVLLSTPEGESRAWRLYRRLGFTDVLRGYLFTGDARPFAVLGRALPLEPSTVDT